MSAVCSVLHTFTTYVFSSTYTFPFCPFPQESAALYDIVYKLMDTMHRSEYCSHLVYIRMYICSSPPVVLLCAPYEKYSHTHTYVRTSICILCICTYMCTYVLGFGKVCLSFNTIILPVVVVSLLFTYFLMPQQL